jgi:hypothetical protein
MDTNCESLWKKIIGKPCILKGYTRFDEGELEIGYGCDTGTLTDERVKNGEHKVQPEATTPALYSIVQRLRDKMSYINVYFCIIYTNMQR